MDAVRQSAGLNVATEQKRDEIMSHSAWHGDLTGIEAEGLLNQQLSGTYLLRQGEKEDHYYLSYVVDNSFYHLPIKMDSATNKWFYKNGCPHFGSNLKGFIEEIMHRDEADCHPLVEFASQ